MSTQPAHHPRLVSPQPRYPLPSPAGAATGGTRSPPPALPAQEAALPHVECGEGGVWVLGPGDLTQVDPNDGSVVRVITLRGSFRSTPTRSSLALGPCGSGIEDWSTASTLLPARSSAPSCSGEPPIPAAWRTSPWGKAMRGRLEKTVYWFRSTRSPRRRMGSWMLARAPPESPRASMRYRWSTICTER